VTTNPPPAAEVLVRVLPQLVRFLHTALRDYPLTLPQLRVLAALHQGERPMGEVAAELGVRPPTLTGLVDALQHQGLVTRRRDPVAWRVVRLGLSPAGRDVYQAVHMAARRRLGRLVAALPAGDQDALARVLVGLEDAARAAAGEEVVPAEQLASPS
jgi:DNA-binding MarR family transcriptional regulator